MTASRVNSCWKFILGIRRVIAAWSSSSRSEALPVVLFCESMACPIVVQSAAPDGQHLHEYGFEDSRPFASEKFTFGTAVHMLRAEGAGTLGNRWDVRR
jgi:hypothetical protein